MHSLLHNWRKALPPAETERFYVHSQKDINAMPCDSPHAINPEEIFGTFGDARDLAVIALLMLPIRHKSWIKPTRPQFKHQVQDLFGVSFQMPVWDELCWLDEHDELGNMVDAKKDGLVSVHSRFQVGRKTWMRKFTDLFSGGVIRISPELVRLVWAHQQRIAAVRSH